MPKRFEPISPPASPSEKKRKRKSRLRHQISIQPSWVCFSCGFVNHILDGTQREKKHECAACLAPNFNLMHAFAQRPYPNPKKVSCMLDYVHLDTENRQEEPAGTPPPPPADENPLPRQVFPSVSSAPVSTLHGAHSSATIATRTAADGDYNFDLEELDKYLHGQDFSAVAADHFKRNRLIGGGGKPRHTYSFGLPCTETSRKHF